MWSSCSVGAKETDDLPFAYLEADIIDGSMPAISFAEIVDVNHGWESTVEGV